MSTTNDHLESTHCLKDSSRNYILQALDNICPEKLESCSYNQYVIEVRSTIAEAIKIDGRYLLLVTQAIKDTQKPCFKRDVLLQVLSEVIAGEESLVQTILCHGSRGEPNITPWKEMANCLTSMPDLIANCNALSRFENFRPDRYYEFLITSLYRALETISTRSEGAVLTQNQTYLFLQILGRVAISGSSEMVWTQFTSRALSESRDKLKRMIVNIVTLPIEAGRTAGQFEIFSESLYVPIFHYHKSVDNSGTLIKSLIGDKILYHEGFRYIICNKLILQTSYSQSRHRQIIILSNIFAYLASLVRNESGEHPDEQVGDNENDSSLLMKTLLEVTRSWSNGTKILLRPYEQSRYITCALLIAFRFALECDRDQLRRKSEEMQSSIAKSIPVYLNKSSSEHRKLAMCLGGLLLPKLHELMIGLEEKSMKNDADLDFELESDEDYQEMRRLLQGGREMIDAYCDEKDGSPYEADESNNNKRINNVGETNETRTIVEQSKADDDDVGREYNLNCRLPSEKSPQLTIGQSAKRAVIEVIDDGGENDEDGGSDDDLVPYEMEDDNGNGDIDTNEVCATDDDFMSAPIYLQDCINGLAENNKPRYVRLCLAKAGELIQQLSSGREANDSIVSDLSRQCERQLTLRPRATAGNDAIRDMAVELAQLLLYLDDQFNIEGFDGYRMKAMCSLAAAAPDLVVKHLLEEFNGTNRNMRHQLDILQVLVASAQQLSSSLDDAVEIRSSIGKAAGEDNDNNNKKKTMGGKSCGSINRFARYAPLYIYGIIHRLKVGPIIPTSIVSEAAKSSRDGTDDSYLLSRIFFSISILIKCLCQQPITCKLSNDILDVLANYKNHPDSGVRRSIVSCLKVIRDSTPSVHFKEYLEPKMAQVFGPWLSLEVEFSKAEAGANQVKRNANFEVLYR